MKFINIMISINAIIYTVVILSALAFFCINFTFFDFWYICSIFLHGTYSMYAISVPTKNGDSTPKNDFIACVT